MEKTEITIDVSKSNDLPTSPEYADLTDDQLEDDFKKMEEKAKSLTSWPDTGRY
jgi:hypothetical protein